MGTKLKVAQTLGRRGTVGIDLAAMCVNDVLTAGAAPLFFLDYIAAGKIDPEALAEVVEGIAEGCRRAGCVLLGGETAEMPDFYAEGVYDLAGFAVGVAERDEILGAHRVREGDALIGLPSSGLHSNGFSLVRRALADEAEWKDKNPHPELGPALGDVLLEPTKIYSGALSAIRGRAGVRAIAHITGGGLPGNVSRILPPGLRAKFRAENWRAPKIFALIAKRGPVERAEMFKTFNMGLGLVIAVDPAEADGVMSALAAEEPCRAGEVLAGEAGVEIEGTQL